MFGSKSPFDKYLEKATSQLLLEPDWDSILQISDCIRQGDVQPKYAINSIKRKVGSDNPHVSLFALQVLESCMKNCGSSVHNEVATKEFMEFMKQLVTSRGEPVKSKILELIQVWSHAFRNEPGYKVVQDTFNLMKLEGYTFPTLKEADAMFSSEKAPEWKDSDCCSRCRVQFGMVQRKHHCRACGDVVCAKCSSKNSIIPKFGIEREVRVCDSCHEKINKGGSPGKSDEDGLPAEYLASPLSKQSQVAPKKSEQEIQEEEELQLALALSQSEEENKAKERERMRGGTYNLYGGSKDVRSSSPQPVVTQQNIVPVSAPMIDTADMDPELARYLNRNYWQQKSEDIKVNPAVTQPSAPVALSEAKVSMNNPKVQEAYQNGETEEDPDQFLHALNSSVEIFVNRMRSNSQRGRSIATDSSVQSLFNVISNMHPQLMKYIQGQEDLRAHYESLQDKLAQLRDAREALDALREDHREKRRREMEELERQRQIQMAHKLEIMRQKKHEYLEMQRQLALQRLQEQEREMQMRFEQQRQLTHMRQMQAYGYNQPPYPQGPMPGAPGGFNPATGQMEGSPVHQLHQQPPGQYLGNQPMYGALPTNQGQYGQGPIPGQQAAYQSMPPGGPQTLPPGSGPQGQPQYLPEGQMGYNRPDGMQPQGGGGYQPQGGMGYMPPASGGQQTVPQNLPSHIHMAQGQGYSSLPPNVADQSYQGTFNMQGMASNLPNVDGQPGTYTAQQPQYMGGPGQGGQYQQPAPQGAPQSIPQQPQAQPPPQQGQPQNMGPPPGQQQHQPGPNEAELISFD